MTKVLHIIGPQGIGKSTLARDLKAGYELRGLYCENLTELGEHEPGRDTNIRHFREQGYRAPNATRMKRFDLLIVEHLHDPFSEQVRRGDLIIRMERAA